MIEEWLFLTIKEAIFGFCFINWMFLGFGFNFPKHLILDLIWGKDYARDFWYNFMYCVSWVIHTLIWVAIFFLLLWLNKSL